MLPFDGILLACQYRIIEIELKSSATELVLIEYVWGVRENWVFCMHLFGRKHIQSEFSNVERFSHVVAFELVYRVCPLSKPETKIKFATTALW